MQLYFVEISIHLPLILYVTDTGRDDVAGTESSNAGWRADRPNVLGIIGIFKASEADSGHSKFQLFLDNQHLVAII